MAKKVTLSEASNEELIAELQNRLGAASGGEAPEFPSDDQIDELDLDALQELATQVTLDHDGKDDDELKALLKTYRAIGASEDDIDAKGVKALCLALGLKPVKDNDANIESVREYMSADSGSEAAEETTEEAAEETEEASEEASEETEETEEASEEEEEEATEETEEAAEEETEEAAEETEEAAEEETVEIVPAEVVAANKKWPAEADMKKRLEAYNKVAGKKAIDVKKLGTVKAYKKLAENFVTNESVLAVWGKPYVSHTEEGYCCGLPMKDVKIGTTEAGKCLVTAKYYAMNDKGQFVEKVVKSK